MNKEQYAKNLRSRIVANIKHNFNVDHHELLEEWGYGSSLRKIRDIDVLKEILFVAQGGTIQSQSIGSLDEQGRYAWALMKEAGWDTRRLRSLMIKKCGVGTWKQLSTSEKKQVIQILKSYQQS